MNDITFVEAARVFAQNIMDEFQGTLDDRLNHAFLNATARVPQPEELAILKARYQRSLETFRSEPSAAQDLIHVGEFAVNETLDVCELAAMTTVTSLILNLDEVVTKE